MSAIKQTIIITYVLISVYNKTQASMTSVFIYFYTKLQFRVAQVTISQSWGDCRAAIGISLNIHTVNLATVSTSSRFINYCGFVAKVVVDD